MYGCHNITSNWKRKEKQASTKRINETDKRKIESYKHILLIHGNYEQI